MLVQVTRDYYDKDAGKKLRIRGALLDYEDAKRAEELIDKGVAVAANVETVAKVKAASKATKK